MKLRNLLLAATVLAAPIALSNAAKAQPVSGIYVAGGLGYEINDGFKGTAAGHQAKVSTHNGYDGVASVGYGFGNGLRVELQGDYFENRFRKASSAGQTISIGGKDQTYGGFVNALYDLDVGLPFLYPYLGAGVGYQEVGLKGVSGLGYTIDQSRGSFAYQGIAGVALPISGVPGLSATVEYRFTDIVNGAKYSTNTPYQAKLGNEQIHSFNVGLRYAFGVAAPMAPAPAPVAAAPAPAPAKTYLVFFDWDKYNLTPRATQIIAEAASDSKTAAVTKITVSGYTDTSGTPTYNQGLSVRRAKAVAVKLMADGVPASEISIFAYGETHLLVPTGPGVREPQNRRVEIVLN
ncbi:MAG: flagellar motor protein MotB [Acidocella sp. 20-57-95]|nr:MAG: flagellar motor protein MotB [Acidocella sp. 20-57-95]OYV62335.1 MAG: flagellar motor protein MotB [Acidocella sp. 21-58-7]HQT63231.1 OmpA family protein [Acidocella sp.]HQU03782.1 OmpA family protein [Acidocella sp.]